jgi:hypothetical protein
VLALAAGWNLVGNSSTQSIDVATVFNAATAVNTVWKWDAALGVWQFYTPSMDTATLQSYTIGKGYRVLGAISPGEGYWVQAKAAESLNIPYGTPVSLGAASLVRGWNLVATADNVSPSTFNLSLSAQPVAAGTTPINLTSLWAWDTATSRWYFYAPNLQASGELAAYAASHGYLDFTQGNRTLGNGAGFWVNKP